MRNLPLCGEVCYSLSMRNQDDESELRRGAVGIAVLALLRDQAGHGYDLTLRLKQRGESLAMSEGAIYPLLHRFERQGLVESTWGRTNKNRRAKVYSVTPKGERWLDKRAEQWTTLSSAMTDILTARKPLALSGAS